MKKLYYCFILILVSSVSFAQSPYTISPDWYFGGGAAGGRLRFPNGNFPLSGAPAASSVSNLVNGVETSTSVCHKDQTVALYTSSMQVYNGSQTGGAWSTNIRDINNTDTRCAGSCTGGGVAFPNPAGGYYLVVGNDLTGGICGSKGYTVYRFTGTGTGVAYAAGPNNLAGAGPTEVVEGLAVGTDGTGGYWLVGHTQAATNTFRVWHITAAGFSGYTDYNVGTATPASGADQSYIKISPCQDKIAFSIRNTLVVHNFNRATGAVGAQLRYLTGGSIPAGDGLEFSPDGNKIYLSGLGTAIQVVNIATGAVTAVAGSPTSWTMQMGPDGNLYTSYFNGTTVGKITNLNGTASAAADISLAGGTTFAGLINMAWLSPETPVVNNTGSGCSRTVTFDFENYFNTDVAVDVSSVVWDFGDGSPTVTGTLTPPAHTYPSTTTSPDDYTVTVTFKDAYCGHTWTASKLLTITCPLPVNLLNFSGASREDGVLLSWQTAMELNNDYFDVQRSLDGVHFESIAHKSGAGNSNRVLSYQHKDPYEGLGIVYYRLVQHDFDGSTIISNVIAINLAKGKVVPVSIAPNPFAEAFVLTKLYDEQASIVVYDILGRVLEQKQSSADESVIYLGASLTKGTYIVHYTTSDSAYSVRVEKQ